MMATRDEGTSPKNLMTARDLLEAWALRLEAEQTRVRETTLDQPIAQVAGRLVRTIGTLHLYELTLPQGSSIEHDTPISIIPLDDMDPVEGIVLGEQGHVVSCKHSIPLASPVPTQQWFLIELGFWPPQPIDCAAWWLSRMPIDLAQQIA